MKNVLIPAAALALMFAAIPSYGQHPAEIGIDGGWTGLDSDISNSDAWRVDFRAGFYIWDWIELEGQAIGARASEDVGTVDLDTTLLATLVNGVFGVKKGRWVPYALVGLGGANVQVSPGISSFSDFAFAWQFGGGTRFFVGKNVALRAEVSQLREKTFDAWNGHWNVTGGISWTFGER